MRSDDMSDGDAEEIETSIGQGGMDWGAGESGEGLIGAGKKVSHEGMRACSSS